MKGTSFVLIGLLLSIGMAFSQETRETIEQLDRESLERDFRKYSRSRQSDSFHRAGLSDSRLKSSDANIGNPPEWNWVKALTGSGGVEVYDMVRDGSGNLYLYGTFSDSMRIGGTNLVSVGLRDVFVAKIGSFGTLSWMRQLEALPDENIHSSQIALSPGGVVIAGQLDSETISGGGKMASRTGDENQFMARISSVGTVDWLKVFSDAETIKIQTDANNNIYRLTPAKLIKYDPLGSLLWSAGSDGSFFDIEAYGNSFWLSGYVTSTGMAVGDSVFNGEWSTGAFFLAQIDASGVFGFVQFMATYTAYITYPGMLLEIDSGGDLYLAGNHRSEIYLRDTIVPSWPHQFYLIRMDTNMNLKWMRYNESESYTTIQEFIKVGDDQFIIQGEYNDSLDLGGKKILPKEETYGNFFADVSSDGNIREMYHLDLYLRTYLIGPSNTIYSVSGYNYDRTLYKNTFSGAESWYLEIWNNGGEAAAHWTMDIDEDGNLYAQGYYGGSVDFFGTQVKGEGIFFMKFRNDGKVEWFKTMENSGGYSYGIRVDNEGNVYAWGGFREYIRMEGLEFYNTDPGSTDLYLVKLDSDGQLKFIKQFDGKGTTWGWGGIDLTPENDVVITGTFTDTLIFGAYTQVGGPDEAWNIFATKISSSGNILWARNYGGGYTAWGRSIASDSMGNVYLAGGFADSITFDTISFIHREGVYDFFLTKLDPNGNVMWSRRGGEDNFYLRGHSITVDGDNVYVLGLARTRLDYQPTISFGDQVFISEFEYNNFLASYGTSGGLNWAKIFKINKFSWPSYKIDTDPKGNIYAAGVFQDTIVVESNLVVGSGAEDFYVTKYSPEGQFRWLKTSASTSKGELDLYSLAVFEEDVILAGGTLVNGSVEIAGEVIKTASRASYAALLGEDIIGCVIELTVETVDEDFGMENGTAELTISGGTAPYEIAWTNGEVGPTSIDSLSAGSYQVTVVDAKGCEQFTLFSINHDGPQISIKAKADVSCHGAGDGFIDIDVTGGTGPYNYYWDNGYTTQDLSNLIAAPYTLTVQDAEGRIVSREISIKEPKPLDVSYDVKAASCGGTSDGSITVFTSGGTKPYDWEWNTGVFTQSLQGEKAGKYTLTVLDANNCTFETEIALSEANAPLLETEYIQRADCGVANGAARVRVVESIGGDVNFLWSDADGTTEPEIVGQRARGYFVTATDTAGCRSIHLVDIEEKKPADNQICLVTVDTTTINGANLVVWEKDTFAIEYRVYRETSAKDVYLLAGTVTGSDLSVFTDSVANPTIRSYRYQIAAVDECGNESYLSHLHKTVHLTISPGLSDNIINLRWDDYIGESFESFEIWRYTSLYGWEMLEEQPSTLKSYTDISVPPGKVFYNVRVPMPNPCEPEGNGTKAGTGPYYHSLSNMDDNKLKETGVKSHMADMFYVYPNPGRGKVTVWSENFQIEKGEILVSDLAGRTVWHDKFEHNLSGRLELDLSGQASGTYIVQLRMDGQAYYQKLIKQ